MMNMEPAPILLQKHMVVRGDNLGAENPCPIEYRNIFIKKLGPHDVDGEPLPHATADKRKPPKSPNAELLARIDAGDLPSGYEPARHQEYVDRRMAELSEQQRGTIGRLWKEKEKIDPEMPNRGFSFVKILKYVAEEETIPAPNNRQPATSINDPAKSRGGDAPERRSSKPVNGWKWSAETDEEDATRKTIPVEIPEGPTIYVVPFEVLDGDKPPVVLLPKSRLLVSGRLTKAHPVYFGVTINHPNGDFAGRFLVVRPAEDFRDGEDFDVSLDFQDFELDSSLAEKKDKLPGEAFHFVVESIWFTTLENEAGLEIIEVELTPPSEATLQELNRDDARQK
jgi:hypothetical protein